MASPTEHAYLSPSAAHRWLVCTPSAALEKLEPSKPSIYAKEGTEAHELAEIKLSYALGYINDAQYEAKFEDFKLRSQYYNAEFNEFVNAYLNEVMTIIKEDYKGLNVKVHLEDYVTFDDIVPDGGGTSDVVIVGKDFIHIIDLKFGKGVPVSAIGNPQLKLYALGAIRKYISECICSEVRQTIIQPRLYNISTDFISTADLNKWSIEIVKPAAKLAIAGQGDLVPGEHCKFCKCRGKCEVLANKQLAIAQAEFEDVVVENKILEPCNMSPEMLSRILTIAPRFIDWFKDVNSYAAKAAIYGGVKIPGYKIVEGRSTRQIINPEAIEAILIANGFKSDEYLKPKELLGITALEKNVGKKTFEKLCGEYVIKPAGALTLVPESDKRTAIDAAQLKLSGEEFNDIETDIDE